MTWGTAKPSYQLSRTPTLILAPKYAIALFKSRFRITYSNGLNPQSSLRCFLSPSRSFAHALASSQERAHPTPATKLLTRQIYRVCSATRGDEHFSARYTRTLLFLFSSAARRRSISESASDTIWGFALPSFQSCLFVRSEMLVLICNVRFNNTFRNTFLSLFCSLCAKYCKWPNVNQLFF